MLNLVSIWKKNCIFFENYIAHRGIRSVVFIFLNPIWFYVEKGLVAKKNSKSILPIKGFTTIPNEKSSKIRDQKKVGVELGRENHLLFELFIPKYGTK